MEITCQHCGEHIGVADDTPDGQKVKCPFCNEKFFYKEEKTREEITEEDLATSLSACRRDPEKDTLYSHAPEGARLYIALGFYGYYYGKQVNVEKYMASFVEIEPLLAKRDLEYLVQNETSPELIKYFQDLAYRKGFGALEENRNADGPLEGRENRQGKPTVSLGIIRPPERTQASASPVAVRRLRKIASAATSKNGCESVQRTVSPLALCAAAVAVVILLVLVFKTVVPDFRQPDPSLTEHGKSSFAPVENVTALHDVFRAHVETALEKLAERQALIKASLQALREDNRTLTSVIQQTVEKGNMKAAEAQTKRRMRLNGAETALAVLRTPEFNKFAYRYLGEQPQTSANACRLKVEEAIKGISREVLTDSELQALDQVAISYQDMCVGNLRRSMGEKEKLLMEASRKMGQEARTLQSAKNDAYYLKASEVSAKENELKTLMQTETFASDCQLRSVQGVDFTNSNARGEDEYVLPLSCGPIAVSVPVTTLPDGPGTDKKAEEPRQKPNGAARSATASNSEAQSGGRRQKCKFAGGVCLQFADRGHNFCSEHECHSYGCKEQVVSFTSPNWVRGGFGAVVNQSPELRDFLRHKTLGHFCKKHCCKRVCPQPRNYRGWWEDWLFWRGQNTETFFFCDKECLANSRYCCDHACKVPTCAACREERWQLDNGSNAGEIVSRITPRDGRDWVLIAGPMCFSNRNVDPDSVRPRELRTEGDLKKERDERCNRP